MTLNPKLEGLVFFFPLRGPKSVVRRKTTCEPKLLRLSLVLWASLRLLVISFSISFKVVDKFKSYLKLFIFYCLTRLPRFIVCILWRLQWMHITVLGTYWLCLLLSKHVKKAFSKLKRIKSYLCSTKSNGKRSWFSRTLLKLLPSDVRF